VVKATEELQRGRDAIATRSWADAYASLSQVDQTTPLGPEDLELLATSAAMVGRMDDYVSLLERTHNAYLSSGETLRAARAAVTLGMTLAVRGDVGPAGGWFGRAERLVEGERQECVERGYLLLPSAFQAQEAGDYEAAFEAAAKAAEIGVRFRDSDLSSVALHVQGHIRIKEGRVAEGLRLLDEAMVAVTVGEVSPVFSGIVYCGVIAGCEEAFDPRRAREWTTALTRWCEDQPQMVSFTGRCLAHRAGIMQLRGGWPEALAEARRARERCEQAMNRAATGQALYQQGELHRLLGDFAAAEEAYRDANLYGRDPQPGLALLRLAQGDAVAAAGAIRRAVGATTLPLQRAALLPAHVEIMLALGEIDEARVASEELTEIAERSESTLLAAMAAHARGAADLAAGDASAALGALQDSVRVWHELDAPYEAARVRVQLGLAYRALDDVDTGALELEAARSTFERLGARTDLERLDAVAGRAADGDTHGLSGRELEVLRLIAAGKTNREIGATLVVSEHTVARHVQNIFAKLRVSSRTAATAFAFEHELV
jgi:DNA-binding CsgD family transcriptional regulator